MSLAEFVFTPFQRLKIIKLAPSADSFTLFTPYGGVKPSARLFISSLVKMQHDKNVRLKDYCVKTLFAFSTTLL